MLKKALVAAAGATLLCASAHAAEISGAGATFPYPIYAKWAEAFKAKTGIAMNYQSIGSGGGIKQIQSKTVDFGATDLPLKADELDKSGLIQFPMVMGGVVPVVNVKGVAPGQLKLDGATIADIYLGKITKWNDPKIAGLNRGVTLPDQAIAVVHRSDGSGTTFIFTHFLSEVNPEWKSQVGENSSVQWPTGIGGKGNEGVAANVTRTGGAIGYVEYAYAKQNKMFYTQMVNKDGQVVSPTGDAFQAAASGANWEGTPGYAVLLTNQPGAMSWPITGATFILMYKKQEKPDVAKAILQFFDWSYKNGGKMAEDLDYVPMPNKVVSMVEKTWEQVTAPDGKKIWSAAGM